MNAERWESKERIVNTAVCTEYGKPGAVSHSAQALCIQIIQDFWYLFCIYIWDWDESEGLFWHCNANPFNARNNEYVVKRITRSILHIFLFFIYSNLCSIRSRMTMKSLSCKLNEGNLISSFNFFLLYLPPIYVHAIE